MKKEKKVMMIEENLIEFKNQIFIYEESNLYFFQSSNSKLANFSTLDYLEATAAFMKLKETFHMDKMWDIKITDDMRYHINIHNILYWITGGDKTWNNNIYKKTWDEYSDIFVNHFKDTVLKINQKANTLLECRDLLIQELSLPVIYEFSLENKLLK
jgi:hypothetical protein